MRNMRQLLSSFYSPSTTMHTVCPIRTFLFACMSIYLSMPEGDNTKTLKITRPVDGEIEKSILKLLLKHSRMSFKASGNDTPCFYFSRVAPLKIDGKIPSVSLQSFEIN